MPVEWQEKAGIKKKIIYLIEDHDAIPTPRMIVTYNQKQEPY